VLKFLLVLALLALLIWLLYRRLRPYIKMLRQILGALKGTADLGSQSSPGEFASHTQKTDTRLIRCAACKTWIPLSRALNANSESYCSSACVKKAPAGKRRKAAS
jgi:hypothetical protein